ncbi:MAG: chemotaxis protein CheB [Candidatus Dormibacteria bacterium]
MTEQPGTRNIVVIGGSAGGIDAMQRIVRDLPAELAAAIFVVIHIAASATSTLPKILARAGNLPADHPHEGEPIQPGRIRCAPPDLHLILGEGHLHLSHGPREHNHRPAADVLFRSAAEHHGSRVIGVVLSGMLGDGAVGLRRIVNAGGLGIVQDPLGAASSPMPENAVAVAHPQHVVPLEQIAPLIVREVGLGSPVARPVRPSVTIHGEHRADEEMAQPAATVIGDDRPGRPSGYSCPDCSGVLWEVDDGDQIELVCRIRHRYNLESLVEAKTSALEGALWAGVRALEEHGSLMQRLAERHGSEEATRDRFVERGSDAERQARMLRDLIQSKSEPAA